MPLGGTEQSCTIWSRKRSSTITIAGPAPPGARVRYGARAHAADHSAVGTRFEPAQTREGNAHERLGPDLDLATEDGAEPRQWTELRRSDNDDLGVRSHRIVSAVG